MCFILVALPGPEEAFETIIAVAGYQVDMHVWDALTDAVIQEGQREAIFKDDRGYFFTSDDFAECARLVVVRSISRSI